MWGGLLASSCSEDGKDESNLMFVNLLRQLTRSQARIVKYACERAQKTVSYGLIWAPKDSLLLKRQELYDIAGVTDINQLDRELDHLRSLDLIAGGLSLSDSDVANISPRPLALHLYVRCQGSRAPPTEFFGLKEVAR